ncbi:unnamed protein product [Acanthoscelides obtectus]|uniref:Uncharacterized protein n=1 Tax=Acanthoscelides obtectus TaxID=200917 RepID=A0A9P0P1L7_ACAOB|nr:unnamed protein product [Acanthoscelides obtectus]CAK1648951.1 hypothetical protein AOBTE_LOCUS15970 [Acanthoscelides obtectus]
MDEPIVHHNSAGQGSQHKIQDQLRSLLLGFCFTPTSDYNTPYVIRMSQSLIFGANQPVGAKRDHEIKMEIKHGHKLNKSKTVCET